MVSRGIEPLGVRPTPPDFTKIADAYGVPARRIRLTGATSQDALVPGGLDLDLLTNVLRSMRGVAGPALIEIGTP
jgi:acetolactate synthase I/II/III large subunit